MAAGHTRVHVLRGLRRPDQAPGRWLRGSPFLTAGPAPAREQWASASAGFGDGVPWPPQRPHTQLGHSGFASPGCVFQPSDPRRGQRREGGPAPGGAVASPPRCPPPPSPIRGTRTVAGEAWRDLSGCVCAGPSVSGKYRPTRPAHATPRHATPRVANTAAAHSPCSAGLPVPRGPHGVLCREEGRRPFVVVMGQKGLQAWGGATRETRPRGHLASRHRGDPLPGPSELRRACRPEGGTDPGGESPPRRTARLAAGPGPQTRCGRAGRLATVGHQGCF